MTHLAVLPKLRLVALDVSTLFGLRAVKLIPQRTATYNGLLSKQQYGSTTRVQMECVKVAVKLSRNHVFELDGFAARML